MPSADPEGVAPGRHRGGHRAARRGRGAAAGTGVVDVRGRLELAARGGARNRALARSQRPCGRLVARGALDEAADLAPLLRERASGGRPGAASLPTRSPAASRRTAPISATLPRRSSGGCAASCARAAARRRGAAPARALAPRAPAGGVRGRARRPPGARGEGERAPERAGIVHDPRLRAARPSSSSRSRRGAEQPPVRGRERGARGGDADPARGSRTRSASARRRSSARRGGWRRSTSRSRAGASREAGAARRSRSGEDAAARRPPSAARSAPAVPIDLDLADLRALVVSGPNTGGKTVALKTLGLAALLHQAGLRPPAEVAELPVFDRVLADIGDQQSIEMSLSTFSGHLRNLIAILDAPPRSLVLVDELASGTDPVEGSALAQALARAPGEQARLTVVTTHYPEPKEWASATDGVANAATGSTRPRTSRCIASRSAGRASRTRSRRPTGSVSTPRSSPLPERGSRPSARIAELLAEAEAAERAAVGAAPRRSGRCRGGGSAGAADARRRSRRVERVGARLGAAGARAGARRGRAGPRPPRGRAPGAPRGDPRRPAPRPRVRRERPPRPSGSATGGSARPPQRAARASRSVHALAEPPRGRSRRSRPATPSRRRSSGSEARSSRSRGRGRGRGRGRAARPIAVARLRPDAGAGAVRGGAARRARLRPRPATLRRARRPRPLAPRRPARRCRLRRRRRARRPPSVRVVHGRGTGPAAPCATSSTATRSWMGARATPRTAPRS